MTTAELVRIEWDEDRVRDAWQASPEGSISGLARTAGWPRARLRRRMAAWRHDGKLAAPEPATLKTAAPWPPVGRIAAGVVLGVVGVGLAGIGAAATVTY